MAESHVVSALTAKRSELAGLIQHHRTEIERAAADLKHLDATLKLFSPNIDLRTIRAKPHRQRNQYFKPGECQRLVLEIFRDTGGALSSRQIAEHIVERKHLENSVEMIEQMQKNAIGILHRLEKSETVRTAGKNGQGQTWELVS